MSLVGRGTIFDQLDRRYELLQWASTSTAVVVLWLDRSSVSSIESPAVSASPGEFR